MSRRNTGLLCLLLALLTAGTFLPCLKNDFLNFDDNVYVTANPHVRQGLTWQGFVWALGSNEAGNWHPLTWLSHMLDWQLYGPQAWGHHLTSVLLHAVNVVLLFLVLRSLTGAVWPSFFVAALFGLHPLRVESVAWVAERKDVLSTFFWMLTLLAYECYARGGTRVPRVLPGVTPGSPTTNCSPFPAPRPLLFYCMALLFFALGLMSKPMLVTLPFVLLLLDFWPLGRFREQGNVSRAFTGAATRCLVEKIPFFALAAVSCVLTYRAQRHGGAMDTLNGLSLGDRLANAFVAYVQYLGKLFLPVNLCTPYAHPGHWPAMTVMAAAMLLAGISFIALRRWREQPYLLTGWLWFLGTLVPVIGVVQVGLQSMADRYTYVPCIGVLVAVIWGVGGKSPGSHVQSPKSNRPMRTSALGAAGASLMLLCAGLTRQQIGYWKDTETLFQHAIDRSPKNWAACGYLGNALFTLHRLPEAEARFRQALAIRPDDAFSLFHLGLVLQDEGRLDEAIREMEAGLQVNAQDGGMFNNLGTMLHDAGRIDEAIARYRQALQLKPDDAPAHFNLGIALVRKENFDAAIGEFREALRLQPDYVPVHYNLGVALMRANRADEAAAEFRETLRHDPKSAKAHYRLGLLARQADRRDEARAEFAEALKLQPGYSEPARQLQEMNAPNATVK